MHIRRMESTDAAAVAELSGQLGYPATELEILQRIQKLSENVEHAAFVAEDENERVVGWLHAFVKKGISFNPYIEVTSLVIDEKCRGQGMGQKLLSKAEKWAVSRGYATVAISSQTKREDAHRFYVSAGYEQHKTSHKFVKRF